MRRALSRNKGSGCETPGDTGWDRERPVPAAVNTATRFGTVGKGRPRSLWLSTAPSGTEVPPTTKEPRPGVETAALGTDCADGTDGPGALQAPDLEYTPRDA